MDGVTTKPTIKCTKCQTDRDPSWYPRDRRRRSWRTPWCRPCLREASRLRRTGLTQEEYDALLAKQAGSCGICATRFDDDVPARIDRSAAGVVRGLLCPRCKVGLSTFRDDPEQLQNAASYLAK
jgi:hypothetical protein